MGHFTRLLTLITACVSVGNAPVHSYIASSDLSLSGTRWPTMYLPPSTSSRTTPTTIPTSTHGRPTRRLIDVFGYNGEEAMLVWRLKLLRDVVDTFVIVEGDRTFVGTPKAALTFTNATRQRLVEVLDQGDRQFAATSSSTSVPEPITTTTSAKHRLLGKSSSDRIIYIRAELYGLPEDEKTSTKKELKWQLAKENEMRQREAALQYILSSNVQDDDAILGGDLDEVPRLELLREWRTFPDPVKFKMRMFYYNFHCSFGRPWTTSYVVSRRYIRLLNQVNSEGYILTLMQATMPVQIPLVAPSLTGLSNHALPLTLLRRLYGWIVPMWDGSSVGHVDAGWHCSYFMPPDKIVSKLKGFTHVEFSGDEYANLENIQSAVVECRDLFSRDANPTFHTEIRYVFPQYMDEVEQCDLKAVNAAIAIQQQQVERKMNQSKANGQIDNGPHGQVPTTATTTTTTQQASSTSTAAAAKNPRRITLLSSASSSSSSSSLSSAAIATTSPPTIATTTLSSTTRLAKAKVINLASRRDRWNALTVAWSNITSIQIERHDARRHEYFEEVRVTVNGCSASHIAAIEAGFEELDAVRRQRRSKIYKDNKTVSSISSSTDSTWDHDNNNNPTIYSPSPDKDIVFIMEDDAVPRPYFEEHFWNIFRWAEAHMGEWDVINLATSRIIPAKEHGSKDPPTQVFQRVSPELFRSNMWSSAVAMLYNRRVLPAVREIKTFYIYYDFRKPESIFDFLLAHYEPGMRGLRKHGEGGRDPKEIVKPESLLDTSLNALVAYPTLVWQSASYSDIMLGEVNYTNLYKAADDALQVVNYLLNEHPAWPAMMYTNNVTDVAYEHSGWPVRNAGK